MLQALGQGLDWQGLDLLYRVPVRGEHAAAGSEEVFFHILLEHQSTPDVELRFRLLSYVVEILRRLRKERGRLEKAPVILPLVIAQVAGGWRISPQYADFVAWPEGLRPDLEGYVPRFEHLLIDLARESNESLRGNPEVRLALGLLKASAEKRLMEWLEWGMALMRLVHSPEMLQVFFRYLASMESGINLKTVAEKVRSHRLPQAESVIMTIADELRAEGREEARAEVLTIAEQLRAEGREEARREFLSIAQGALIGAVQTLERLLGKQETPAAAFAGYSLQELQARVEALNEEVRARLSR